VAERARRASLAAALASSVAVAALVAPSGACATHECDQSFTQFDLRTQGVRTDLGSGRVQWASSAWDGAWLDYPAGRFMQVNLPPGFVLDGPPTVWVSTGQNQDASGATATSASGQLAQVFAVTPTSFDLQNAGCAEYYVWFGVQGTQSVAADAGVDAGADAPRD